MHARTGDDAEIWHRRLAHLNFQDIGRLVQEEMVKGINLTMDAIKDKQGKVCEPCVMGKQHRLPFPKKSERETEKVELLHMDVCGPLEETSFSGARYIATFTDDATRFTEVRIRFPKTKAEVQQACKEVINLLENQTNCKVKSVHLDNGKEYVNQELGDYFKQRGIKLRNTPPYTPEQNGVAERLNRTLLEKTRSMLADAGLPKKAWAEATSTANYLRNISPVSGRRRTPWELMYGVTPDISGLRVFGARTFVHIPKKHCKKLDVKSEKGHLVGFSGKAYRVLLPGGRVTRDVVIDETKAEKVRVRYKSCWKVNSQENHLNLRRALGGGQKELNTNQKGLRVLRLKRKSNYQCRTKRQCHHLKRRTGESPWKRSSHHMLGMELGNWKKCRKLGESQLRGSGCSR
jgi:uncharacterized protein (DUF2164 family)